MNKTIKLYNDKLIQAGLYRKRSPLHDPAWLSFSSNDYLSLRQDKRIQAAYIKGFELFGGGSGASPVIAGYHAAHQALEKAFCQVLQVEDALLFTSGYAANLAVCNLLAALKIPALIDKGMHASIYDGMKQAHARFSRYLHGNMHDLAIKIRDLAENGLIMTEGIFSMSGQQADLTILASFNKPLIVDEAHSFGVINQAGLVAFHDLTTAQVPLRIIPLGKACAGLGAIVAGSALWIDALLQSARSYIYSTALAPGLAYGLEKTLEIVVQAQDRRQKLQQLIQIFQKYVEQSALNWNISSTPIQFLKIACPHQALKLGEWLQQKQVLCMPVRYPTVHPKNAGLRIVLNYHHEEADIQRLFQLLDAYHD